MMIKTDKGCKNRQYFSANSSPPARVVVNTDIRTHGLMDSQTKVLIDVWINGLMDIRNHRLTLNTNLHNVCTILAKYFPNICTIADFTVIAQYFVNFSTTFKNVRIISKEYEYTICKIFPIVPQYYISNRLNMVKINSEHGFMVKMVQNTFLNAPKFQILKIAI